MNAQFYPDLAVAVLAGGSSSRFGSDKALFRFGGSGQTLIERSVSVAKQLSDRAVIVGHVRYEALELGVTILPDELPGRGPLGGIRTALRLLDRPRVFVLGCDMPCLSLPLLRWMASIETDADIVIPRTADGRYQTLHAIYQATVLPDIDDALAGGSRAIVSLLSSVRVLEISESEMRQFDPRLDSIQGVNRPEDVERARRCAR